MGRQPRKITTPPPNPSWLTVADVAELLAVNERTVRRWIASGRLPASKPGGRDWRISARAVDALTDGERQREHDDVVAVIRRLQAIGKLSPTLDVETFAIFVADYRRRHLLDNDLPPELVRMAAAAVLGIDLTDDDLADATPTPPPTTTERSTA